ncbi:glycerol uptake facilitator-like aquaporin [Microbacterium sp. AG1240]|uniref:aquaporin n=1 Tax=Microbacterium sp. AG1240 TaxID=2183992 RepID=UPI000F24A6A1|nr:aquaporin [Microbacterium sp. AG1240]RKT36234.1 glycerol uptake facilitator-like aquaporin [Microbacterium sp. AG1240]
MNHSHLMRRAVAETLGTGLLVAVVVGSGIAASRLSTDGGIQLLANSLVTAMGLTVLILLFGPVSGAHLNPMVSTVDAVLGRGARSGPRAPEAIVYVTAQISGAIGGAVLANLMFDVPTAWSTTVRTGPGVLLGEVVATAGLLLLVLGLARAGAGWVAAPAVGAYIGAAYWFTSSTSFANPAVTVGRMFTDTFAGIAPTSVLPFLAAQLLGAILGAALAVVVFPRAVTGSPVADDVVVPQTIP